MHRAATILIQFILQVLAIAICLIPLWIFLAFGGILRPDGFWQKLVYYVLGIFFLGGLQLLGLVGIVMSVLFIWFVSDGARSVNLRRLRW